nr:MAG TPA: hypothetical protein [Caudoviricetes sp.]
MIKYKNFVCVSIYCQYHLFPHPHLQQFWCPQPQSQSRSNRLLVQVSFR